MVVLDALIYGTGYDRTSLSGHFEMTAISKLTQWTLGVLFFALIACGVQAAKPNIVFILADDMGYGDVQSLNPDSKIPTPNLNQLAADGMTFTDGHSPSAVCTPTRYATLTGRYCWRSRLKNGVLGGYSKPLLGKGQPTLASFLRRAGYATGAVGKWHLGMELPMLKEEASTKGWGGDPGVDFGGVITDSPIHHGFDSYFGVSASLDMAPYVYIRNDRFTKVPTLEQDRVPFPHFVRNGPRADDFVIADVLDRLTEEATSFIKRAAGDKEKPFFLYMPLTGPHKPTQPHERFRGKTGLGEYGDFVHQVDWTVGEVLKTIDDVGVRDNTLVVYSSDNGSYMFTAKDSIAEDHVDKSAVQKFRRSTHKANGDLRGTKADVYEAGHRVPLFVRWPGKVDKGSKCNKTVCLTDFFATFSEVVGQEVPEGAAEDSYSLLAMLSGDQSAERGAPVIHHSVNGTFAIRDGKLKMIAGMGSGGREKPKGEPFSEPYQLYDIDADVSESNNLALESASDVKRLSEMLDAMRK
jgi:arylsulfatase A-like enzyme